MAVRFSLTAAVLLLALSVSRAEWNITSSETDRSAVAGIEHRRIVLNESSSGEDATLDLALFSAKNATVRVVDNPNGDYDLAAVMRRTRGIAGVNGGYFDPENAPVGLLISDGKPIAPLRKARLLSGVLVVTKTRVELIRSGEYSTRKNVTAAIQCGPFLVEGGKPVAGLNNTRPARRTFVVTSGPDRAAVGFCSTVTLAQLGDILATPELKTQRALNFDGGSSSAFWFAGKDSPFSISEQKTVRDFLIVTPK
ncbi:MAG TPA: phosphodiester glycosidase family protein [Chthoniobacterales bacterium]|nr:phosphodiester glycosidase family protein [Chthoniobacterales bacterium]